MNATFTTNESSGTSISTILKLLVLATYASLLVAVNSGLATVFIRPPEGSSLEAALGITAATAGIAIAAFGSSSIALLFRWRRWIQMPLWAKAYTGALLTTVVISWIVQIIN